MLCLMSLQEPELLEQIFLGMGAYEGLGRLRLRAALRRANKMSKAKQAGPSSSPAAAVGVNSEVVQLLVRASEQYGQVSMPSLAQVSTSNYINCHTAYR